MSWPIKRYTDNCIHCKLCIRACYTSLFLQEINYAVCTGGIFILIFFGW